MWPLWLEYAAASVCLKANETTQHRPAKWPSLSRRHLCVNMNRSPGSWGFNPLIRHQTMAEWVLNEWRLSFHCPLYDHCASYWNRLPLPSSCYKPITKPTGVFIIKFKLQTPSLTHLSLSPMPYWALSQGTGVVTRDWVLGYISCRQRQQNRSERSCSLWLNRL